MKTDGPSITDLSRHKKMHQIQAAEKEVEGRFWLVYLKKNWREFSLRASDLGKYPQRKRSI